MAHHINFNFLFLFDINIDIRGKKKKRRRKIKKISFFVHKRSTILLLTIIFVYPVWYHSIILIFCHFFYRNNHTYKQRRGNESNRKAYINTLSKAMWNNNLFIFILNQTHTHTHSNMRDCAFVFDSLLNLSQIINKF